MCKDPVAGENGPFWQRMNRRLLRLGQRGGVELGEAGGTGQGLVSTVRRWVGQSYGQGAAAAGFQAQS